MLSVEALKEKITEKGFTIASISKILGINPSTFYRKTKKNSFEIGEADRLVQALSLSATEANEIFFNQFVA